MSIQKLNESKYTVNGQSANKMLLICTINKSDTIDILTQARTKSICIGRKRIVKLVKLQSLVGKCCKISTIKPSKICKKFVYICITTVEPKLV